MKTDDMQVYRIQIEGIDLMHFSREEIEYIEFNMMSVSVVDGSHFQGIWYHVRAQNTKVLHLPGTMADNLFNFVGIVAIKRRNARLDAEREREVEEEQF